MLVHQCIILRNHLEHLLFARLDDMPAYYKFFKDEVGLVEVEYQVQFADVPKVTIKDLNEVVDHIKHYQLVVFFFHTTSEVEGSVSKFKLLSCGINTF